MTDRDTEERDLPDNVVIYLRATTCAAPHDADADHDDECGRVELHIDDELPAEVVFGVFNSALAHYMRNLAARGVDPTELVEKIASEYGATSRRGPDIYSQVPGNPFGAIDPFRGGKK